MLTKILPCMMAKHVKFKKRNKYATGTLSELDVNSTTKKDDPIERLSDKFQNNNQQKTSTMGLIWEIMHTLNVPNSYIADKLDTKRQAVALYHKREVENKITLETLNNFANCFGLEVQYTFVPKYPTESLMEFLRDKVRNELLMPKYTYLFEGLSAVDKNVKLEKEVTKYLKKIPKSFWRIEKFPKD